MLNARVQCACSMRVCNARVQCACAILSLAVMCIARVHCGARVHYACAMRVCNARVQLTKHTRAC